MKLLPSKEFRQRGKKFLNDGKNHIRLLFIGLSLVLWFFIKLSKTGYISTVHFGIDYSDLPEGLVLTEEPPQNIQLKLQGSGYSLLKYSWFSFKKLDIDLSNLESNRKGESYWTSKSALNNLEAQFVDESTRILDIKPDSIFINLSKLATKSIPVELVYNPLFDTNAFSLYGEPQLSFDSVLVEAPTSVISSLKSIKTKAIDVPEPSDSMDLSFELDPPKIQHLSLERNSLEARLEFSRITEGKIQTSIELLNVPDSVKLELFPSQTEIVFRCALRDYKSIRPKEFRVYVDYNELLERKGTRFLSLKSEEPPSQIRSMEIQPKRVEFLLSKP